VTVVNVRQFVHGAMASATVLMVVTKPTAVSNVMCYNYYCTTKSCTKSLRGPSIVTLTLSVHSRHTRLTECT